ncbi:hypothetical protein [Sporichthya polymorpha]|uniref:hypothetical protein n=1 Tax=Sporichthya polymorpha TaxID=35751 RepID=UPI00035DE97C|nr:hypothetical protein [Sporichthya polymorpha]
MRRTTKVATGLAGVAATLGAAVGMVTPAQADDTTSGAAVGTASASGIRTSYDFPGYLVVDTLYDAGGPISQAVVNSSGGSSSFASFPYPGDTVVNAPALANVGTGQAFPFTYPLYVVTDGNLTPKASAQDATGSLKLDAESDARTASSTAKLAGPVAGVISTAGSLQETSVVIGDDGVMTSIADSILRGIDVDGVLKIGEVHVRTTSVLKPGESKPTTTSVTDVTGVSVLGQPVGLSRDGIMAPGGSPGTAYAPILDQLNQALKDGGISVALAGGNEVNGGASNAGVEILQRGKMPFAGSPEGVARTLIGNASSFILGGSSSLLDIAAANDAGTTPAGTTPAAPVDAATGVDVPVAAGALPTTGVDAAAGVPTTGVPTVNFAPQAGASTVSASIALDLDDQMRFFYLVIALGAGIAVLCSLLWRASIALKGGRA